MKTPRTEKKMLRWIRARFGPAAALEEGRDIGAASQEWPRGRWVARDGPAWTNTKPTVPSPAILADGTADELCWRLKYLVREREYEAIARKVAAILRETTP